MDFHSLSRKELQILCKKNKIPANQTNVAMADALAALTQVEGAEEVGNLQSVPQTPQPSSSTSKLVKEPVISVEENDSTTITRTRRGATRRVNKEEEDNQQQEQQLISPAPRTTRRRAATATVSKNDGKDKEEGEIQQHEQEPPKEKPGLEMLKTPAPRTTRRRAAAAATVSVSVSKNDEESDGQDKEEGKNQQQKQDPPTEKPVLEMLKTPAPRTTRRGAAAANKESVSVCQNDGKEKEKSVATRAHTTRRSARMVSETKPQSGLKKKGGVRRTESIKIGALSEEESDEIDENNKGASSVKASEEIEESINEIQVADKAPDAEDTAAVLADIKEPAVENTCIETSESSEKDDVHTVGDASNVDANVDAPKFDATDDASSINDCLEGKELAANAVPVDVGNDNVVQVVSPVLKVCNANANQEVLVSKDGIPSLDSNSVDDTSVVDEADVENQKDGLEGEELIENAVSLGTPDENADVDKVCNADTNQEVLISKDDVPSPIANLVDDILIVDDASYVDANVDTPTVDATDDASSMDVAEQVLIPVEVAPNVDPTHLVDDAPTLGDAKEVLNSEDDVPTLNTNLVDDARTDNVIIGNADHVIDASNVEAPSVAAADVEAVVDDAAADNVPNVNVVADDAAADNVLARNASPADGASNVNAPKIDATNDASNVDVVDEVLIPVVEAPSVDVEYTLEGIASAIEDQDVEDAQDMGLSSASAIEDQDVEDAQGMGLSSAVAEVMQTTVYDHSLVLEESKTENSDESLKTLGSHVIETKETVSLPAAEVSEPVADSDASEGASVDIPSSLSVPDASMLLNQAPASPNVLSHLNTSKETPKSSMKRKAATPTPQSSMKKKASTPMSSKMVLDVLEDDKEEESKNKADTMSSEATTTPISKMATNDADNKEKNESSQVVEHSTTTPEALETKSLRQLRKLSKETPKSSMKKKAAAPMSSKMILDVLEDDKEEEKKQAATPISLKATTPMSKMAMNDADKENPNNNRVIMTEMKEKEEKDSVRVVEDTTVTTTEKALEKKSLRQLKKIFKEKLVTVNNKGETQLETAMRPALQTLTNNCLVKDREN